ncbi:uncharacterized protein CLUP02_06390 [Colletotrichum lupini]|uniref:Uncharacterized protein n=1 Tax=Colletotrichum lupini TaxID=145971 RepID=A0A9Q8SPX3_9PEZI|nr:uncharacterized protein CLUP02_06390 [Colletotrichum lupini]UQC80905.1 hypothetical protein CLUP02_06390 [Colletotrichum lupini]
MGKRKTPLLKTETPHMAGIAPRPLRRLAPHVPLCPARLIHSCLTLHVLGTSSSSGRNREWNSTPRDSRALQSHHIAAALVPVLVVLRPASVVSIFENTELKNLPGPVRPHLHLPTLPQANFQFCVHAPFCFPHPRIGISVCHAPFGFIIPINPAPGPSCASSSAVCRLPSVPSMHTLPMEYGVHSSSFSTMWARWMPHAGAAPPRKRSVLALGAGALYNFVSKDARRCSPPIVYSLHKTFIALLLDSRIDAAAQLPRALTSHSAEGRSQFSVFAFFDQFHPLTQDNLPALRSLVQCFRCTFYSVQGELVPHHSYGCIPSTLSLPGRSGHRYTTRSRGWSVDKIDVTLHSYSSTRLGNSQSLQRCDAFQVFVLSQSVQRLTYLFLPVRKKLLLRHKQSNGLPETSTAKGSSRRVPILAPPYHTHCILKMAKACHKTPGPLSRVAVQSPFCPSPKRPRRTGELPNPNRAIAEYTKTVMSDDCCRWKGITLAMGLKPRVFGDVRLNAIPKDGLRSSLRRLSRPTQVAGDTPRPSLDEVGNWFRSGNGLGSHIATTGPWGVSFLPGGDSMSTLVNADLCPASHAAQTPSSVLDANHDSAMRSALQSSRQCTQYPDSEHDLPLNPLLVAPSGRTAVGSVSVLRGCSGCHHAVNSKWRYHNVANVLLAWRAVVATGRDDCYPRGTRHVAIAPVPTLFAEDLRRHSTGDCYRSFPVPRYLEGNAETYPQSSCRRLQLGRVTGAYITQLCLDGVDVIFPTSEFLDAPPRSYSSQLNPHLEMQPRLRKRELTRILPGRRQIHGTKLVETKPPGRCITGRGSLRRRCILHNHFGMPTRPESFKPYRIKARETCFDDGYMAPFIYTLSREETGAAILNTRATILKAIASMRLWLDSIDIPYQGFRTESRQRLISVALHGRAKRRSTVDASLSEGPTAAAMTSTVCKACRPQQLPARPSSSVEALNPLQVVTATGHTVALADGIAELPICSRRTSTKLALRNIFMQSARAETFTTGLDLGKKTLDPSVSRSGYSPPYPQANVESSKLINHGATSLRQQARYLGLWVLDADLHPSTVCREQAAAAGLPVFDADLRLKTLENLPMGVVVHPRTAFRGATTNQSSLAFVINFNGRCLVPEHSNPTIGPGHWPRIPLPAHNKAAEQEVLPVQAC